jgi:hypothetical protein
MIVKKPHHEKSQHHKAGERHLSFRARGKIVVKAKTKEEAEAKFREKLEEMLNEETDYTWVDNGLSKRMASSDRRLLGIERPTVSKTGEESSELKQLTWSNRKNTEPDEKGRVIEDE